MGPLPLPLLQTGQQRRGPLAPPSCPPWQVEAAILKLHSRRVCCLAFPDDSDCHVISGDKKGGIAIWNFMQVGACRYMYMFLGMVCQCMLTCE